MREARDPMRFFGLYPFRVDVGVGEHPGELHERNHGKTRMRLDQVGRDIFP